MAGRGTARKKKKEKRKKLIRAERSERRASGARRRGDGRSPASPGGRLRGRRRRGAAGPAEGDDGRDGVEARRQSDAVHEASAWPLGEVAGDGTQE